LSDLADNYHQPAAGGECLADVAQRDDRLAKNMVPKR
jgi:hypothetical protein